jgi:hypothetical protein
MFVWTFVGVGTLITGFEFIRIFSLVAFGLALVISWIGLAINIFDPDSGDWLRTMVHELREHERAELKRQARLEAMIGIPDPGKLDSRRKIR